MSKYARWLSSPGQRGKRPWKGQAALEGVQLEDVWSWGLRPQTFLCTPPPLTLQNLLECRAGRPLPTAARRGLASSIQRQLLRRAQGSAAEALGPSRSARCTRSRPRPLERECEWYRLWLDTSYSRTKKAWGDV